MSHLGISGIVQSNSHIQIIYSFQSYIHTHVIAFATLFSIHSIVFIITQSQGQSTIYFTNGPGNQLIQSINNQVSSTMIGLWRIL